MEVSSIASLLAGPGGAMVLLALVLWMAWKLANKALDLVSSHLTRIEEKFDTLNGAVQARLFEVKESLDEVQRGVRKLRVVKEGDKDDARES
jgi:hypothetical protein